MRKFKFMVIAMAFVPVSAFLIVSQASTASAAATCLGSSCFQHSAPSQGCTADAEIVKYKTDEVNGTDEGQVELEYSPTCRAAWGRVWAEMNYDGVSVLSSDPTEGEALQCEAFTASGGIYVCDTDMVNDDNYTSYASGQIDGTNGWNYNLITGSY